jgi:hypothetical protein
VRRGGLRRTRENDTEGAPGGRSGKRGHSPSEPSLGPCRSGGAVPGDRADGRRGWGGRDAYRCGEKAGAVWESRGRERAGRGKGQSRTTGASLTRRVSGGGGGRG